MGRQIDALTAGLLSAIVATAVAYVVGRDRRLALAAGGLSGAMTAVATVVAGERDD
jgi:uncharacterized transporter YbjL